MEIKSTGDLGIVFAKTDFDLEVAKKIVEEVSQLNGNDEKYYYFIVKYEKEAIGVVRAKQEISDSHIVIAIEKPIIVREFQEQGLDDEILKNVIDFLKSEDHDMIIIKIKSLSEELKEYCKELGFYLNEKFLANNGELCTKLFKEEQPAVL